MPIRRFGSLLPKKTPRRGSEEFPSGDLAKAVEELKEEEKVEETVHPPEESEPCDSAPDEMCPDTLQAMVDSLLKVRTEPPGTSVFLSEKDIMDLCMAVRPILMGQPMLLELMAPMKICGDIHGQYHDLLQMLEKVGYPPASNYLFLGDYVDRGLNSIETICLLMAYKVKYPENFFILRGNHETEAVNRVYGFYDECKRRYSVKLYKTFCDTFNCLPIAATLEERILCMHGGLSPEIRRITDIADIQRPCEVPEMGVMCDLLWADPDFEGSVSVLGGVELCSSLIPSMCVVDG